MPREDETLPRIVRERLVVETSCYRHCDKEASFHQLDSRGKGVVGLYACPSGFVSRVVYFDRVPDISWYKGFLKANMSDGGTIEDRDVRIATRHPWDLGLENSGLLVGKEGLVPYVLREAYWSPPRGDEKGASTGAFLCAGCGRIFIQHIRSANRLCPSCSRR